MPPPSPPANAAAAVSRLRTDLGPWGIALVVATWVIVLPWMIPVSAADHGIFVSVAERLQSGDRLYEDVWDNKDPLFYYTLAVGRAIAPVADVALEMAWMLLAGASVVRIGRALGISGPASLLAGLAMTPIALTGSAYLPGHTHLPGVALTLAVLAAILAHRHVLGGLLLAGLAFTKLVMVPLALALAVLVLAQRRDKRGAVRGAAGAAVGALGVVGILAVRGELGPYLEAMRRNVLYSQGTLVDYAWSPVAGHLERVLFLAGQGTIIATATVLAAALFWPAAENDVALRANRRTLWFTTLLAGVTGLVLIAVTGLWFHHAQVLYVAAALACLMAAAGVGAVTSVRRPAALATLVGLALLLGGPPNAWDWIRAVERAPDAVASLGSPSTTARALLDVGPTGSYARVGQGEEGGHASGLDGWDLACPRFHQYIFEPASVLEETLRCLPSAEVILISQDAVPFDDAPDPWNDFVRDVDELLARDYTCESTEAGRLCVRR